MLIGFQPNTIAPLKLSLLQQTDWEEQLVVEVQEVPTWPISVPEAALNKPWRNWDTMELDSKIWLQHWMDPVLQEFEITFTPLGTAATEMAIEAVAKRASLENMFKMSEESSLN